MKKYLILFLLVLMGCSSHDSSIDHTTFCFDTVVQIKIPECDKKKANQVLESVIKDWNLLEPTLSAYDELSEVSKINISGASEPINISINLRDILLRSREISVQTNGAFDITIRPVLKLWDFNSQIIPDKEAISSALPKVCYEGISTGFNTIECDPAIEIDLGGIAKGFLVDYGISKFTLEGINNILIDAGGDLYASGTNMGKPWRIGIQHPRKPDELIGVLEITDRAVATSGDYERYFIKDGIRYHHILDPKTGYPARGCISATVLAPDTMTADAWATAVFVMGESYFEKQNDKFPEIDVIMVLPDGRVRSTKSFPGLPDKIDL